MARTVKTRRAVVDRTTKETSIQLALALDGRGKCDVRTGIRFLDHMLELVARHGGFDLKIRAAGDLDVDQHHTVEDLGIALGEAVTGALGSRRGINRAGYFVMPMDETLAVAAIDLGGRVHSVVDLNLAHHALGISRPSWSTISSMASRKARGQRSPQGPVRTFEPPPDRGRVQSLCARLAGRLLEGSAARQGSAINEGFAVSGIALIDYGAGNLTSVEKASPLSVRAL